MSSRSTEIQSRPARRYVRVALKSETSSVNVAQDNTAVRTRGHRKTGLVSECSVPRRECRQLRHHCALAMVAASLNRDPYRVARIQGPPGCSQELRRLRTPSTNRRSATAVRSRVENPRWREKAIECATNQQVSNGDGQPQPDWRPRSLVIEPRGPVCVGGDHLISPVAGFRSRRLSLCQSPWRLSSLKTCRVGGCSTSPG